MAFWAQDKTYANQLNLLMLCIEVGRAGRSTAQRFGQKYRLPAAVINGFVEQSSELPKFGQLGCKGFVVLGPDGEFAMRRTVPCYLEAGQRAFRAVESSLGSLWGVNKTPLLASPGSPIGVGGCQQGAWPSVGVPAMDEEHEALETALEEWQASPTTEGLAALLELWQTHSQHEEELFERHDFGRHKSAAPGEAATVPHCEHHRHIARMMGSAMHASSSTGCRSVPAEVVAALVGEMSRHAEVYDAAYAGRLGRCTCTAQ